MVKSMPLTEIANEKHVVKFDLNFQQLTWILSPKYSTSTKVAKEVWLAKVNNQNQKNGLPIRD